MAQHKGQCSSSRQIRGADLGGLGWPARSPSGRGAGAGLTPSPCALPSWWCSLHSRGRGEAGGRRDLGSRLRRWASKQSGFRQSRGETNTPQSAPPSPPTFQAKTHMVGSQSGGGQLVGHEVLSSQAPLGPPQHTSDSPPASGHGKQQVSTVPSPSPGLARELWSLRCSRLLLVKEAARPLTGEAALARGVDLGDGAGLAEGINLGEGAEGQKAACSLQFQHCHDHRRPQWFHWADLLGDALGQARTALGAGRVQVAAPGHEDLALELALGARPSLLRIGLHQQAAGRAGGEGVQGSARECKGGGMCTPVFPGPGAGGSHLPGGHQAEEQDGGQAHLSSVLQGGRRGGGEAQLEGVRRHTSQLHSRVEWQGEQEAPSKGGPRAPPGSPFWFGSEEGLQAGGEGREAWV